VRSRWPVVSCDAEDGECGGWDLDYWTQTADTVNGIKITNDAPAPGWVRVDGNDYCPDHAP
jgi:hypothetical protein